MKLSEKLLIVANWLESEDNDLVVTAEDSDENLFVVASALVKAADALREGAEEVSKGETTITPESLEEIAAIAQAFDESGDTYLQKQASVLDELLMTVAAPRNSAINFRQVQDDRIEELKKKYNGPKKEHDAMNKVSDNIDQIKESPVYKTYRPLEAPLSTRYCPAHAGVSVIRVAENTWQCPMDKAIYNYETGFKLPDNTTVPGGDVANQIPDHAELSHAIFSTREQILGNGNS